jgi:Uma2 family endonuclease
MAMPAEHTEWTVDMVRALPDDGNRYEVIPEYWIVNTVERIVERWRPDNTPVETLNESLTWSPDQDAPSLLIDLPSYFDRVLGLV